MDSLKGKNILFISPKFFNYEVEIAEELKKIGAVVTWFDERPSNTFSVKLMIRLDKRFLKNKIKSYYEDILSTIGSQHFDYLFIISPESLSQPILHSFKNKLPDTKIILYMWDSFKNKGALELLPLVDEMISFDPNDARKYGLKFRPLFYIDDYKANYQKQLYNFLFIGTAHSDRYLFVQKLIKMLPGEWNFKLYFFLSSKKLFWGKRILDVNFKLVKKKDISFTPLSHEQNADLVHRSEFILDINHPEQIGLTMRTFETLGAQKKLITTNQDIVNYDFYHPNNILVIDRALPIIPDAFLNCSFVDDTQQILQKYSLNGWIKDIFKLK